MHLNFHFTAVQVLWTLTFAAQLVLLVVLLGKDRARRFPWFTIGIVMMALRLLASRLLLDRMPPVTLSVIFIAMADAAAVVGFLVVAEMARRAFAPARRGVWLAWALGILVVGGGILALWGRPWPAWKTLTADSFLADMNLLRMIAQRLDMLVDLLNVELGLVVVLLGRRFRAGWHSHVQRLVIGLATASAGQLSIEAIWQRIAMTAVPHSQAEYDHVVGLREKLFNANGALYVAVLVWWIIVLWIDEPGAAVAEPDAIETPHPEYLETGSVDGAADPEEARLAEAEAEPGE
jgi:hypothetical protein